MIRLYKGILDFVLVFLFLFIFSLFIFILIIFLSFNSNGPIFFIQKRVGKDGKEFNLIKFRTMKLNTLNKGTHLLKGDEITTHGKWMRSFKLDELPQIINVIQGHMSFVGPRPCLPNQYSVIDERTKRNVLTIKPGITGLSQIKRVDMSNPKLLAKIDQMYMEKMNIFFDLKLLFLTAFGKGIGDTIK